MRLQIQAKHCFRGHHVVADSYVLHRFALSTTTSRHLQEPSERLAAVSERWFKSGHLAVRARIMGLMPPSRPRTSSVTPDLIGGASQGIAGLRELHQPRRDPRRRAMAIAPRCCTWSRSTTRLRGCSPLWPLAFDKFALEREKGCSRRVGRPCPRPTCVRAVRSPPLGIRPVWSAHCADREPTQPPDLPS
jgi:hypothetical protein